MKEGCPCVVNRMRILIALVLLPSIVAAEPTPTVENTFGFDAMKPKGKCAKVTGALKKKLDKSYACTAPDPNVGTASGKTLVASCKAKKGKSEYQLFATQADCNEERETQLANGG